MSVTNSGNVTLIASAVSIVHGLLNPMAASDIAMTIR